ncbi:hypothetical protein GOBAR_DD08176 [Gossypium barbadense]|nr:hypothetical protein GOBAR_DD08176 [Gossypium barbadense]
MMSLHNCNVGWAEISSDSSEGNADGDEGQEEEANGEEDDKTIEDATFDPYHDGFEDVFAPTNPSTRSPIILDPSDQPGMSYKKFIMKGKSKGVAGPIEGPNDDQH